MPEVAVEDFLDRSGWGSAARDHLAGDASNRSYERLTSDNGARAVLMHAPPERGEDIAPFLHVTEVLRGMNLSAPTVIAQHDKMGLLLLEDLGDDLFARVLEGKPEIEEGLYSAATDVLARIFQRATAPGLPPYGIPEMMDRAALAFEWFARAPEASATSPFLDGLRERIERLAGGFNTMTLRDYHAENLIWLPEREGIARVGLLDYQDAALSHPAYDLVSLVEDARRDVSPELAPELSSRFCVATGLAREPFLHAMRIVGLQRNLRILGVFARLCLRDGKPHYVDLIPRVWRYVEAAADAVGLSGALAELPAPTSNYLDELKRACGTYRTS